MLSWKAKDEANPHFSPLRVKIIYE